MARPTMVPLDVVLTAVDAAIRLDIPMRELRARLAALPEQMALPATDVPKLTKAARIASVDEGADELERLLDAIHGPDRVTKGNGTYRETGE